MIGRVNDRKIILGSYIRVVLEPCFLVHRIWTLAFDVTTKQTGITESLRTRKKPP